MIALGQTALAAPVEAMRALHLREAPLFLGLPEAMTGGEIREQAIAGALRSAAAPQVDLSSPRFFRAGRAACFQAIAAAVEALHAHPRPPAAVVGAIDSLCDPASLAWLADRGRVLGGANADGLLPGEGAAVLLLARPGVSSPLLAIEGGALATDPRPFNGDAPSLADGLTQAFRALRLDPATGGRRVDRVLAAQPGESFWATELSRAYLRNAALMPEPFTVEVAADSFGDAGAAAGALLISAFALRARGGGPRRALAYGCSDTGQVGACVVEALA
jgi:3-oxoacyl-[acyl-carrier-protein] synthase-1